MRACKLLGRQFGRLTVLRKSHDRYYECICECGTVKVIQNSNIYSGSTKSCGCLKKEHEASRKTSLSGFSSLYAVYKRNARLRGKEFGLSKSQFLKLVKRDCHYCGEPPNPYNGVDRFYNNIGYEEENCITCCKICNQAKNDRDPKKFEEWLIQANEHLFGA